MSELGPRSQSMPEMDLLDLSDHEEAGPSGTSRIAGPATPANSNTLAVAEANLLRNPDSAMGVIRISGIPWETSIKEVDVLVGGYRAIPIPTVYTHPRVHVVADAVTTKTEECFIEYNSVADATLIVSIITERTKQIPARHPHLQARKVKVEQSSQAELMEKLFPRSKCTWIGGVPTLKVGEPGYPVTFNGFITNEEQAGLIKWAARPQKARFSSHAPQRPFEFWCSVLIKVPWYDDMLTDEMKERMFKTTKELRMILEGHMRRNFAPDKLEEHVLHRFVAVSEAIFPSLAPVVPEPFRLPDETVLQLRAARARYHAAEQEFYDAQEFLYSFMNLGFDEVALFEL